MANPILSLASFSARVLPMPLKRALYRLPFAGGLRKLLNRAAPQSLSQVEVAAGELKGVKLLLDMHSQKDYWLGTYEPELQAAIKDFVKPGDVAYDVGANIGYVSLMLARHVGPEGRVISFEALPDNLVRIESNLSLNPRLGNVRLVPKAVVDTPRSVEFLVHASGGMGKAAGSAGREEQYQETLSISGTSLDDFVYVQDNPPPDVIKLDIEGGEVLAMPGMQRLLAEAKPVLFIELHGPEAARVVWDTLTEHGYSLHIMQRGYPAITAFEDLDWKAYLVARPSA
ncbi:MAG: FkbM family methyltransferase [Chloroflexi bacterium]|nr:MAG: FkbM family methyltransferase [Chloroflexota bacterium]NOH11788.1 FkbM family methyltransferase [Chloroflexota bacterium]